MTTVLFTVVAVVSIVAGFLERRSVFRAVDVERGAWRDEHERIIERMRTERDALMDRQRDERHDWANERSALLDRIKPETAQPPPHLPNMPTFQPPASDEEYWVGAETE